MCHLGVPSWFGVMHRDLSAARCGIPDHNGIAVSASVTFLKDVEHRLHVLDLRDADAIVRIPLDPHAIALAAFRDRLDAPLWDQE